MSSNVCVDSDLQCDTVFVCYQNATWNDDQTICTCSHWYGWSGPDCLELNSASYFLIGSAALQGVIALVGLVLATVVIATFLRSNGFARNAQVATMAMVWLSMASMIGWRMTIVAITSTPGDNTLAAEANDEDKIHQLVPVERAFIAATFCFGTLALLNVSLLWVQVAEQSKRMTRNQARNLAAYSRTILVVEAVWVVGLIGLFSSGNTALIAFFAAPFIVFIIVTYAIGASRLTGILNSAARLTASSSTGDMMAGPGTEDEAKNGPSGSSFRRAKTKYDVLIRLIRLTAIRVVVCVLLAFVSSLVYALMTILPENGQRGVIDPNDAVHTVVVFNEGIPLFILLGVFFVLLYLRANIKRAARAAAEGSNAGGGSSQELTNSFERTHVVGGPQL